MSLKDYTEGREISDLGAAQGGITEGASIPGMEGYLEYLKLDVLEKILEKLNATDEIGNTINAGWQGASRDKFLRSFQKTINNVKDDISSEFYDLTKKLSELLQNYFNQDARMMDFID